MTSVSALISFDFDPYLLSLEAITWAPAVDMDATAHTTVTVSASDYGGTLWFADAPTAEVPGTMSCSDGPILDGGKDLWCAATQKVYPFTLVGPATVDTSYDTTDIVFHYDFLNWVDCTAGGPTPSGTLGANDCTSASVKATDVALGDDPAWSARIDVTYNYDSLSAVPEPATLGLFSAGILGVTGARRWRGRLRRAAK